MPTTESSATIAHPHPAPPTTPAGEYLEHVSTILTRSIPEPQPAYVLRGLGLFEIHRDEILESYQGGGRWLVPSGTESGRLYEVRVGTRPERNRCECTGFQRHEHCSHVVCAGTARKQEERVVRLLRSTVLVGEAYRGPRRRRATRVVPRRPSL